jgi:putative zinc finger/helix-turn-helix YgiT family protein
MKSPITGKEMQRKAELRELEFRKEKFEIHYHFYFCSGSKEQFTDRRLDELNLTQLHNKYRDKNNLPFPDEIKLIREQYDLPATKMSEILGFGINSYRNYESGEVPSAANGKLIRLSKNPKQFLQLVELAESIEAKAKQHLLSKIERLIEKQEDEKQALAIENYLVDGQMPNEFTGYRKPNFKKFEGMVQFFTEKMEPWKTQLNKLLYYADAYHYKYNGYSISGTRYRAIQMGPVPHNFQSVFEYMANADIVNVWETEFDNGGCGEQFKSNQKNKFDATLFEENELHTLEIVAKELKNKKTKELIELSHKEKGWKENEKKHGIISYDYAFDLKGI